MNRFDVLVPCYNYGSFLRECVESILSQSVDGLRVLIIDDASPDNTAEVASALAREDARVEILRHTVNRGHIATYNEGIEWASADYLMLLSADDILMPGALARAASVMDAHPDVGMTYSPVMYFSNGFPVDRLSDPGVPLRPTSHNKNDAIVDPTYKGASVAGAMVTRSTEATYEIFSGSDFIRLNRHYNQVHTPTVITRTEMQKRIGGYRPELPHYGDLEMWTRFAAHGSIGYIHAFQGAARNHGRNMSSAYYDDRMRDLNQRKLALDTLFNLYGDHFPNVVDLRRYMYRGLAEHSLRAASSHVIKGDRRREMLQFATMVDPEIRGSLLWYLCACKRHAGGKAWYAASKFLRPLVLRLLRYQG